MHEIPVAVHEKVISELAPAMNQLRDALCEPLPPAGCLDISCFSSWLSDFGTQGEAVADSVEAMGSAMLQWRGQVHTEEILCWFSGNWTKPVFHKRQTTPSGNYFG